MKINLKHTDSCLTDFNYDDFENLSCVRPTIKGIHDELHPTMYAYEQQIEQINQNNQTINMLDELNNELQYNLSNEMYKNIFFHHNVVLQNFFLYLTTKSSFALEITLHNIQYSLEYFDKVYKQRIFEEIPDFYLQYIKILSFFEKIEDGKENFHVINNCLTKFKISHIEYLRNGKENFDSLFHKAIQYGNLKYETYCKAIVDKNEYDYIKIIFNDLNDL